MKRLGWYILENDGSVRPARDMTEGAEWFQSAKRHIGNTIVGPMDHRSVRVSTVFIGLDHNFTPSGPPLVFETMVFETAASNKELEDCDDNIDTCTRYATLEEALAGHQATVEACVRRFGAPARVDSGFGFHPAVKKARAAQ